MHVDTDLLLSAERLQLEPNLIRGRTVRGTFTFKCVSSQTYLVVNELQTRVLAEFTQPRNVPDVLETCIRRRTCPPLREFYDLIVKAHRAGVLRCEELDSERAPMPLRPPVRWLVPLPPEAGLVLAGAGLLLALIAILLQAPVLSLHGRDILKGWLIVCGALSLGQVLAASTLRGAGCEVHRPHLRWFSLTPHFAVELDDRCMTDWMGRAGILAVTVLPLAVVTAMALLLHQSWGLAPVIALFAVCGPVGNTFVGGFLLLLRREPLLATDGAPLFNARLGLVEQWRVAWRRFDGRVAAVQGVYGLCWTLAAGLTAYRATGLMAWRELHAMPGWPWDFWVTGAGLAFVGVLWLATEIQHRAIDAVTATWRRCRREVRRWRKVEEPTPFELEAVIRRHPLLRQLAPEAQEELVSLLQPCRARPWYRIFGVDEEPPCVGLVVSGRAQVYHRLKSGRKARFFEIMEGDLFGAHRLVDPRGTGIEVRTSTPLLAVAMSHEDFQRIVVDGLGATAVCRYVQNHLFLHRAAALCADWRPAAIARFAELAGTATHSAGGKIIIQGQEVGSLHVLYEGKARTVKDRQLIASLRPGDFFGEISLLQTSAATADVETTEETRCLVVNRVEFIRFLARNQHVALQLERFCSKRLGRPIFPLDHESFDVR